MLKHVNHLVGAREKITISNFSDMCSIQGISDPKCDQRIVYFNIGPSLSDGRKVQGHYLHRIQFDAISILVFIIGKNGLGGNKVEASEMLQNTVASGMSVVGIESGDGGCCFNLDNGKK